MAHVIDMIRLSCYFCHIGDGSVWYEVAFLNTYSINCLAVFNVVYHL